MPPEKEPCPLCLAAPADWCEDPHVADWKLRLRMETMEREWGEANRAADMIAKERDVWKAACAEWRALANEMLEAHKAAGVAAPITGELERVRNVVGGQEQHALAGITARCIEGGFGESKAGSPSLERETVPADVQANRGLGHGVDEGLAGHYGTIAERPA